jgi:hypothetical protein
MASHVGSSHSAAGVGHMLGSVQPPPLLLLLLEDDSEEDDSDDVDASDELEVAPPCAPPPVPVEPMRS